MTPWMPFLARLQDPEVLPEVIAVHLTSKEYGFPPHRYYFPYITNGHMTFAIDSEVRRIYYEWYDEMQKREERKNKNRRGPKVPLR